MARCAFFDLLAVGLDDAREALALRGQSPHGVVADLFFAASVRAFGIEVVARLCERLVAGGAPGIHFCTLNQSALTLDVCRKLGWVR